MQPGDQLAYRYSVVSLLGSGAFAHVYKAFDHRDKTHVAIKVVRSRPKYTEQAKVEVSLLEDILLRDCENLSGVVRLNGVFRFRNHTCLSFELLSQSLYDFLREHRFSGFSLELVHRFAMQVLQSLCFLRSVGVIHCDLKPENILLKQDNRSGVKLIDFGSSCRDSGRAYTYIQSRYYRAPEVILHRGKDYTAAIDMWSFGCLAAELLTGLPLFPGEGEREQLELYVGTLGSPPAHLLQGYRRRSEFFDDQGNLRFQTKHPYKTSSRELGAILPTKDRLFVSFVKRCLDWDPEKRPTPAEACLDRWVLEMLPPAIRKEHIDFVRRHNSSGKSA